MPSNQRFAQIILVSETEDQVGCGKNKTLLKPIQNCASKGFSEESSRSPCSIARNPPDQRQHPGRNHPMCCHFSPSCSLVVDHEGRSTHSAPCTGTKGSRLNSELQVWPCLLMQGKGRAAHSGTKASPTELRNRVGGTLCSGS